jgi:hypothetical protein
MLRFSHAFLLLVTALLFVVGCSQNEEYSPVALEMDFATEKSTAIDSREIDSGHDISDNVTIRMEMAVTPYSANVLRDGDHTVSARIFGGGDPEAYPMSGQEVTFTVYDGPNTGTTVTVVTDHLGNATFTYTGAGGLGTDHIAVVTRLPNTGETFRDLIAATWMNSAPVLEARNQPIFVDQDNHKYLTLTPDMVIDRAEDVFGNTVGFAAVTVVSVSSDEPEDHLGDGSTLDDILIECPNKVMLRTERRGGEQGRVYTIRYRLTDANGTTADDELRIVVVKDGSGKPVVYNRGMGYTVTPECTRREYQDQF